ncbi:uncharacterized protein FA14DRAFT_165614 [Meira miltonrushii]|uniref:Calcium-dependent phosphotriesterase n=1 Tax=Meira miltonrushii TaxID=1280837 RepID=A0A316V6Y9_9BASI|nr:uncharacterized protein FA14DRAFT_165614 [Meira miltonrushii]PWN32954.1 hypothetical protein FA14DRAFT_165614 [Meira miltonrushii]
MSNGSKDGARFEVLSDTFAGLIGQRPHLRKLLKTQDGKALFHEAGIYLSDSNTVILSSNRYERKGKENDQYACVVHLPINALPRPKANDPVYPGEPSVHMQEHIWSQITVRESLGKDMIMPNGATRWTLDDGREGVLWCEQGKHDLTAVQDPTQAYVHSALVVYDPKNYSTSSTVDSFEGKRFSSLNDVVVHQQSGAVFFTDPDYGVEQLFKRGHDIQTGEHAYAPNGVYCWQPKSGKVTLLDSDYVKPNGCTFVPDPNYPSTSGVGALVTTDTGRLNFKHLRCPKSGKLSAHFVCDKGKPACIYAYPVNYQKDKCSPDHPFVDVERRQLVAHSSCSGAPDGIHPDEKGNVWAGHSDGVHAYAIDWSTFSKAHTQSNQKPIGRLIGKIRLPDGHGVANFCWAGKVSGGNDSTCPDRYRMLLFAEDELWEAIVAVNGFD